MIQKEPQLLNARAEQTHQPFIEELPYLFKVLAADQAHALVAVHVAQGKVGERAWRRFFSAHGGGALETDAAVPVDRALDGGAGGVDDG